MPECGTKKYWITRAVAMLLLVAGISLPDQQLLFRLMAKTDSPHRTPIYGNAHLSFPTQNFITFNQNRERPVLPFSYLSTKQRFIIHYTTAGKDAVDIEDLNNNGVPDRVEKIAQAFETSYEVEIDSLNYNLPPSFEGGAKPYEVYIVDLSTNYAITVTETDDSTAAEQRNVSSYILFDNDFVGAGYHIQGDDAIKVTAAHEFFHAIQLGYVFRKTDAFFFELSAVWMENQVFGEVKNYLYYLDYFFADPEIPLSAVSFTIPNIFKHIYGACVFAFYIEENFGKNAMKNIWERMPNESALEAADKIFKQRQSDFETEFVTFCFWNFFTGTRSRPDFSYVNSAMFPEVRIQSDAIIEYFSEKTGAGYFLTSRYHVFHPIAEADYRATLLSPIQEHWRLGVIVYDETTIETYAAKPGETLELKNVQPGQKIVLIPCNVDRFANPTLVYFKEAPETYQLLLSREARAAPSQVKSFELLSAYPNPFSKAVTLSIKKITEVPITILIFNLRGQQVDQINLDQLPLGLNHVTWHSTCTLPIGIYFCQLKAGHFSETTKLYLSR